MLCCALLALRMASHPNLQCQADGVAVPLFVSAIPSFQPPENIWDRHLPAATGSINVTARCQCLPMREILHPSLRAGCPGADPAAATGE